MNKCIKITTSEFVDYINLEEDENDSISVDDLFDIFNDFMIFIDERF